jgi:hypothetical protein
VEGTEVRSLKNPNQKVSLSLNARDVGHVYIQKLRLRDSPKPTAFILDVPGNAESPTRLTPLELPRLL